MSNVENVKTGMFTYKDRDYNFNFYTDIDTIKKMNFVSSVVNTVVTEDHYQSVLRNVVFDFRIIETFSYVLDDIADTLGKEDKEFSLYEIVDIVENTKIVEIIKANAAEGLIDELNKAVDKDIEYKTGIHRNPLAEGVANILSALESKIKDIDLDALMGFAEAFKGISSEDLTPDKMFDAYANSNAFKQLRDEADKRNAQSVNKVIEIVKNNKNNTGN